MGWQVLDSVGYELNPVRNELLHLWRAFLACYFLGGILLYLKFIVLLFLRCIPYGICIVPCLILFTSHIIQLIPMMLYCLAYFELLLLYLIRIKVCGCSRIIKICACRIIGGDILLIA